MRYFFILLFFAAFSLCSSAQSAPPSEGEELTEQANQESDETSAPSKEPIKTENSGPTESSDAKSDKPEAIEKADQKKSFFEPSNILTMLFGSLALGVSIWSLWQNKMSNESQNRAYLYIQKCEFKKYRNKGYQVEIKLVNGGATPASKIKGNIWLSYSDDKNSEPQQSHEPFKVKPIYIAPSDYKYVKIGRPGSAELETHKQAIIDGRIGITMLGELTYKDQFGKTQEISFRFNRFVSAGGNLFGQMNITGSGLTST